MEAHSKIDPDHTFYSHSSVNNDKNSLFLSSFLRFLLTDHPRSATIHN